MSDKSKNQPSGTSLIPRSFVITSRDFLYSLVILVLILIAAGRALGATQDEQVAQLTKGLGMQSGVVYVLRGPVPPDNGETEEPGGEQGPGGGGGEGEPTTEEYIATFAGLPPPSSLNDASTRSPQTMTRDELAWMAANFAQLSFAQIGSLRPLLAGASYEDRLWAAEAFASAQAAIMANPSATAYGNFGPYSTAYASLVGGPEGGNPLALVAMQPQYTSVVPPASATYIKANFSPQRWTELLSFPLSTNQHENIYTILTSPTGVWNQDMTPDIRNGLLQQLAQIVPAF